MSQKKQTRRKAASQPPTIDQIKAITDQYAACKLECDGMSNVLHYYLTQAGIAHTVYQGSVIEDGGDSIMWHMWITARTQEGSAIIDYRARMWLGERERVPHGVFTEASYPHIHYHGEQVEPPVLPAGIIHFLVARPDIP